MDSPNPEPGDDNAETDVEDVGLNVDIDDSNDQNDTVDEDMDIDDPGSKIVSVFKKRKQFSCLICSKKFNQNAGRYNHMKKIHNVYPEEKSNVKCLEQGCSFTCSYKEKLQVHLSEQHGINMDVAFKQFDNFQEFLRWKDEFERQAKSRFVKKSGSRLRDEGVRVGYYYCSRSGTYISQSKGLKGSKKKGTAKTNNHCTASITCFELPDGKLDIKICSTHYGHDNDLQHLRLTQTEKFKIAEQLCRGVSREMVLDHVRASTGSEIDRIHLITIKDVKNIEKAYGIQANTNEKTNNMYYNLTDWISNIMASDNGPVLYFKEDGTLNSKDHDITLILLTKGQLEVLNKYSKCGVFYITTFVVKSRHNLYSHNLHVRATTVYVTTLLLLDDLNEAVPVSFMLTNNHNQDKLKIFLESIKKRDSKLSASALFTDAKQEIYEVWCSVFHEDPLHLWSNRFIDNDWRENLASIPDEELQVSIYETLYSFLESTDFDKLNSALLAYITGLQNSIVTSKFANYFSSKYIGTEVMWAGCFGKKSVGINAQLNMEITCNEVEEITNKKHWDRNFLVKIVQHLLKSVTEKHCFRQSKLQRQVQEMPSHHMLALKIKTESIRQMSDVEWRVESVKDPVNVFSLVTRQSYVSCEHAQCQLRCCNCGKCAHEFKCTCRVYMFDRTMCKHIHAVALNKLPVADMGDVKEEGPSAKQENDKEKPNLFAFNEWHKGKRGRKKKIKEEQTIEIDINNLKTNFKPLEKEKKQPRKRRRKRYSYKEDNNSESSDEPNVPAKNTRTRAQKKLMQEKEEESTQQESKQQEEEISEVKPCKASILRRSRKR